MLEKLANIAIIAACLAVVTSLVNPSLFTKINPRPSASAPDLRGKPVKLAEARLPGKDSFVLVLSTACHFCKESLPFYKQLSDLRRKPGASFGLLAVFPEDVAAGTLYLAANDIKVDRVLSTPLGAVEVQGTPTILLVSADGVIRDSWIGKLPATGEKDIMSKLLKRCVGCT